MDKKKEALVFKSLKSNPRDGRLSFDVFRTALDVGNGTLRYRVRKRVAEQRRILRGDVDDDILNALGTLQCPYIFLYTTSA